MSALNYGVDMAAGAVTDGPFAFIVDNASEITIDSIVKDGATVLSNVLTQTIIINTLARLLNNY